MKKIILSLAVIGVMTVAGIGATRAYFSSTATSTNNTFNTATMSIGLTNTSYTDARVLDGRNMYPGSFVESAVTINNTGGVAINPDLSLANAVDLGNMAPSLWLEVWTNGKLWYSNWITSFPGYAAGAPAVILDKVVAGGSVNVAFRLIMDENATQQNANYTVNMNITGRQWNDPSYQPTTVTPDAGYVVNTWSYPVCGVRDPKITDGNEYALKAGDTYIGRGYHNATYSPFYSYIVSQTMTNGNDLWAFQDWGLHNTYTGFTTPGTVANDYHCEVQ